MKYFGTKDNKNYGFYEENFNNSIKISDEYWRQLLEEQSNGKMIIPFENYVIAADKTEYSQRTDGTWVKLSPEQVKLKQINIKNEARIAEIQKELDAIDLKRIRALSEPETRENGQSWLEFYNEKARILREELLKLNG